MLGCSHQEPSQSLSSGRSRGGGGETEETECKAESEDSGRDQSPEEAARTGALENESARSTEGRAKPDHEGNRGLE